jgi:hypothetical protein
MGADIVAKTRAWTMIKDKWYSVRLDFKGGVLNLYAQKAGEHPILLLKNVKINKVEEGRLGLYTYNTEGAFDSIRFFPHSDLDPPLPDDLTIGESEEPPEIIKKGEAAKTCLENKEPD